MYKRELYLKFSENHEYMLEIEKDRIRKFLPLLGDGVVIVHEEKKCRIYYSSVNTKRKSCNEYEHLKEWAYHLEIDDLTRIRFEGEFHEYEGLIKKINEEIGNTVIYVVLRMGNIKEDFYIMDIYF